MKFFALFASVIVYLFALDMLWLGVIANSLYREQLGGLLRKSGELMAPNWPAAALVYLCIVTGILFFVLPRAEGHYLQALIWGALFGAVTYGLYDFTNFSILANWPLKITLIDLGWGILVCALTSVFAVFMQNYLQTKS
jgi:uncharacterized membrane protein